MNKNIFIFQLLCLVHIFIWLFVIFGGFISSKICRLNLYIFIPLIYVLHMLPFHILVKYKMKFLNDNLNDFELKNTKLHEIDGDFGKNIDKSIPEDRAKKIISIYCQEDDFFISRIHKKVGNLFSNSFQNPTSPQGMLILGLIINIFLMKFFWKECK
jgi:hypothetical protein